jgi:hypothetical protein
MRKKSRIHKNINLRQIFQSEKIISNIISQSQKKLNHSEYNLSSILFQIYLISKKTYSKYNLSCILFQIYLNGYNYI